MHATETKDSRRWREFDAHLEGISLSWQREARRRLVMEAIAAAGRYREAGEGAAAAAVTDARWIDYLDRVWRYAVTHAGTRAAAVLGVSADATYLDHAAVRYLQGESKRRGEGIAETSRAMIAKWIHEGLGENLMPAGIERLIATEGRRVAQWRGAMIGSTETHAASWFGSWLTVGRAGGRWEKIWAAPRRGGITCDQHKSTHGQRRPLADPFRVLNDYEADQPAESLNYPGDSGFSPRPSNVINCRCAMDFERL
jgi:hypothetical protein